MAKYKSPFHLSGSVGSATFADNNGAQAVRIKSGMSYDTWKKSKKLRAARNQSAAFGAASRLAKLLHAPLGHDIRRLLGPHYHNRITRAILAGAPRLEFQRAAALPAVLSTAALRQLDLGHLPEEGTAPIASTQHHPLTERVTLHGLQKLRDSLPLKQGELLEYRILTATLKVPGAAPDPHNPGVFDPDPEDPDGLLSQHTGQWTPAAELPQTTELPAPHHDNTVLIVAVEWRAIRGLRIRYFRKHDTVRIAAAHTGTRPKDLPWLLHRNPKRRKPTPSRGPNRVPAAPTTLTPKEAKQVRIRHQESHNRTKPKVPIPIT